jgi:hypothetical protein
MAAMASDEGDGPTGPAAAARPPVGVPPAGVPPVVRTPQEPDHSRPPGARARWRSRWATVVAVVQRLL